MIEMIKSLSRAHFKCIIEVGFLKLIKLYNFDLWKMCHSLKKIDFSKIILFLYSESNARNQSETSGYGVFGFTNMHGIYIYTS